jgi:hypothetical protein
MFLETVNEYVRNYKEDLLSEENIIHEMNGIVLSETSDGLFNLQGKMIDEVMSYAGKNGIVIDKIIFVTHYDIEFTTINRQIEKIDKDTIRLKRSSKMKSDSYISIIEKNDKIIARVFMGSSVILDKIYK